MPSLQPYAEQNLYSKMRDLKWSSTERAIARRAFDRILQQELDAAIRSTKEMAARITQPHELWELEHHLTEVRKAIDRKYEYKYSKLVRFFADLVWEGKLDLEDLRGLSEDKLRYIRHYAEISAA
jgi:Photoprotection regulator fluorescence recovery protein